jgi:heavy metal sensor kinase
LTVFTIRSIRFRLTFWYALTLAVILAASGLFSYQYFSATLNQQIDDELWNIAAQIAVEHTQHAETALGSSGCCGLVKGLSHRGNWDVFLLLRGPDLEPICASENLLSGMLPLGAEAAASVRDLIAHLESVDGEDGLELRLLSFPITYGDRLLGVAQIAKDLGPLQQTLKELRLIYEIVVAIALVLLCLGCWLLASRLVVPILDVTRAAREVNADKLSMRLPTAGHEDELGQMVLTLNQMLERLEGAFRKVRQFSGDASHELRTPLTILRGETEVALRWAKTAEEFRDVLGSNLEEIDRMERIIENLLVLTRDEADEPSLQIETVSLNDLVQGLYLQAKTLGEAKQIAVSLRVGVDEELRLRGDELRLRQLFLNLIANAVKYTPAGGTLEITLLHEGPMARVDLTDSGIGIPEDALPHIFDRFYRVDQARNRMDGGSGLGLSIVQALVKAHGGRIAVRSVPGSGSTFSVFLPLESAPSAAPD